MRTKYINLWTYLIINTRGVFRTKSNIYDRTFLQKQLTVFSRQLFSQKSSIVNVRMSSNQVSEYNINCFADVSKLKLIYFLNFFSTINFSYQYLSEAKAYLKPSRTSTMDLFREKIFFYKIHKKTPVLESLFNKVTGLYPANSLK